MAERDWHPELPSAHFDLAYAIESVGLLRMCQDTLHYREMEDIIIHALRNWNAQAAPLKKR